MACLVKAMGRPLPFFGVVKCGPLFALEKVPSKNPRLVSWKQAYIAYSVSKGALERSAIFKALLHLA